MTSSSNSLLLILTGGQGVGVGVGWGWGWGWGYLRQAYVYRHVLGLYVNKVTKQTTC